MVIKWSTRGLHLLLQALNKLNQTVVSTSLSAVCSTKLLFKIKWNLARAVDIF